MPRTLVQKLSQRVAMLHQIGHRISVKNRHEGIQCFAERPTQSRGWRDNAFVAILVEAFCQNGLLFDQTDNPTDRYVRWVSRQTQATTATVEEVTNLIVNATSPQASATTGTALRVDGGVVETIACIRAHRFPIYNFRV